VSTQAAAAATASCTSREACSCIYEVIFPRRRRRRRSQRQPRAAAAASGGLEEVDDLCVQPARVCDENGTSLYSHAPFTFIYNHFFTIFKLKFGVACFGRPYPFEHHTSAARAPVTATGREPDTVTLRDGAKRGGRATWPRRATRLWLLTYLKSTESSRAKLSLHRLHDSM